MGITLALGRTAAAVNQEQEKEKRKKEKGEVRRNLLVWRTALPFSFFHVPFSTLQLTNRGRGPFGPQPCVQQSDLGSIT
ncbi:MAG: hypothetical protein AB7E72_07190 [Lysobacterales bacterium]